MARKVRTKVNRGMHKNDKFMKWFIPALENSKSHKLLHEYIFTGNLFSIILNYDKWHKKSHEKTIKEYLLEDYLSFLESDGEDYSLIAEVMKLESLTEEEILEYAKEQKELWKNTKNN